MPFSSDNPFNNSTTTPNPSPTLTSNYTPSQICAFTLGTLVTALCILTLSLRLFSRRIKARSLSLNDYLAILAFLLYIAFYALNLHTLTAGMGRHASSLPNGLPPAQKLLYLQKMIVSLFIVWFSINTTAKLSMLHLYLQLFPQKSLRRVCWALMAALAISWVVALTYPLVECRTLSAPLRQDDDLQPTGHGHPQARRFCLDKSYALFPFGICNIVLDVAVIILPMPYLYTLKLRTVKKIALIGVFALGFLITITSAVRTWKIVETSGKEFSDTGADVALWSMLETGMSVVNCCLPLIQPALLAIVQKMAEVLKGGSKKDEDGGYLPTHKFITLTFDSDEGSGDGSEIGRPKTQDLEAGPALEKEQAPVKAGVDEKRHEGREVGPCEQRTDRHNAAGKGVNGAEPECRVVELEEEKVVPPRRKNLMWYLYG